MKISGEKLRKHLKYSIVFAIVVSILITTQKLHSFVHDMNAISSVLWNRNADKLPKEFLKEYLKESRLAQDSIDKFSDMEQLLPIDYDFDVQLVDMCNYFEKIADYSRAIFLRGYFCIEDDDEEFKNLLNNTPQDFLKRQHEIKMNVRYFKISHATMQFINDIHFNFDRFLIMFEQKSKSLVQDNEKFDKASINLAIIEYQCSILCTLLALDIIAIIVIFRHTKKMLYFYFLSIFHDASYQYFP